MFSVSRPAAPLVLHVRGRTVVVALDVVAVADLIGRNAAVGVACRSPAGPYGLILAADVAPLDLERRTSGSAVPNFSAYFVSATCTWLRLRSA